MFKPGGRIVDLGAAPGGWSQIAAERVKAKDGKGKVVAVDLLDIEPIVGVDFAVKDFNDPDAPEFIKAMLGGEADGVMSDMAANATGHRPTDHLRIVALAELAADFACDVLAPGGFFRRQGAAGRHGRPVARAAQTRFRECAPCEAGGEPRRFGGALCARDGVSRQGGSACFLTRCASSNAIDASGARYIVTSLGCDHFILKCPQRRRRGEV